MVVDRRMLMYKLYFIHDNTEEFIKEFETEEEVQKYIPIYVKEVLKFKSYYYRQWEIPDEHAVMIDYGSYTRFLKYYK